MGSVSPDATNSKFSQFVEFPVFTLLKSPGILFGEQRRAPISRTAPTTSLKGEFDSLKKTMDHQRMQYPNALLAYNLWTKGMLLRSVCGSQRSANWWVWNRFGWREIRFWRTFRACQQSVCYTIRQGYSCICASRHVTVRGNNSCLYDVRDDL